jgi:hypothetical protein
VLLLAAAAAYASGQVADGSGSSAGAVSILVVDEIGHNVPNAEIQLTRDGQREQHFESTTGKAVTVPYGKYDMEINAPGFRTERRVLDVARPQVFATEQLTVWLEGEPRPHSVLSGEVKQLPTTGHVWAKLVGVYNDVALESPISEGFFVFEPGLNGVYLLMIISDGVVLDIQQITLRGYKAIQVQLKN